MFEMFTKWIKKSTVILWIDLNQNVLISFETFNIFVLFSID